MTQLPGGGHAIAELADHPSRAFNAKVTVFLPETRNTSVKLRKGERLFVLTDKGLEETPCIGPDDVLIVTEHFGCWPVVAIPVRAAHVEKWRSITPAAAERMMARVRNALSPTAQHPGKDDDG